MAVENSAGTFSNAYPGTDYRGGLIQSPEINSKGEPTQKSIRDVQMGRDVVKTVIQACRNRNIVNSRVLAKYNAERPYDASKLEAEGLGWKQNFTTKPLPNMIEKVAPRFTDVVNKLKYLTDSSLPSKYENSADKTERFRETITRTIRTRKGWQTLLEDIAFTNALFGHVIVAHLDEYSWFPRAFQTDESFVSDGTKSDARLGQVAVLKEVLLPHELFKSVSDPEAAKDAGFNLEETRMAINEASPVQIRDRLNVGGTLEFWWQNALRELTIGASYMAGASVVVIYNLLAREVSGKVSHYRFAGTTMRAIFTREERFESMESALTFFTYQKGNGTLHGSKGIGRDIYEMAGMIDRTRNDIVDRMILSGKAWFQGDIKNLHRWKMSILGNTVIVPNGWQLIDTKFDGNVEPYLKMDAYFQMLVDQLIGATSPPRQEMGEAFRSPAAWNLLAEREEEGRDARITRFLTQFTNLVQSMQVRICDPDTDEEDAKVAQKELLEHMTREELDALAKSPVAQTIQDLTPIQRQMIATLVQEKRGNPLYNQRALEMEDLTAKMGAEFAKRVLLPENDPTDEAENHREQQLENMSLGMGQPIPVSPRDNHLVHISVLMPVMEQMAGHMLEGKFGTESLEAMGAHLNEHVNRAEQQGAPKDKLAAANNFLKQFSEALLKLKQLDAHAANTAKASELHQAGAPPSVTQPPAVPDNLQPQ